VTAVASFAVLPACGPGFQAIYDGTARFEHCYALEENSQASLPDKAACWRDWSEHYTYGQTRDRVHYATARYVALSQANLPTDEALMMAAPGEAPRASSITAPAPTNAFAPPPRILEVKEPSAAKADPAPAAPPREVAASTPPPAALPASTCADTCGGGYRACGKGCDVASSVSSGAADPKVCAECMKKYRACMRDCFK
jgi:hypothetical protein